MPRTVFRVMSVLVISTAFASAMPGRAQSSFKATTVILVRHAEKQATPPGDPPLSTEGELRAKTLAHILGSAGVKAVFTSQFIRTRDTARPLAEAVGVAPVVVSVEPDPSDRRKISERSVRNLLDGIYQHEGETILVVGHSNTLGLVISALGGGGIAEIPETEYDNLFVVTVYEKGKARVTRLKY